MGGYADELSLKLTAKDEMSARLKGVQRELEQVTRKMSAASKELKDTGSPEAAAQLKDLEAEFKRLARSQQEAARAFKEARDALKKVQSEAGRANTAFGRLGQSITKHATAIRNAGLIAGAAMLLFAKQSIQAFAEAEKSTVMLQQAYANFPKIHDVTLASFDRLNTKMMNLSGTDDDLLAGAEALLSRFDVTGKQIQELMPLIDDYATATGQDVLTATKKVGMALLGNAKALKSTGVNFKATGNRAEDYAALMDLLKEKVGGVAEAFGKTTAGQLAIAAANFNNLQESVGQSLVPALQAAVDVMQPLVGAFTAVPKPAKQTFILITAVGVAAMVATPRIIAFSGAMKTMGLGLGPVAAVLAAIATSIKGVSDVASSEQGPVDDFITSIKSFAPPMLVPSIFAVGRAIKWLGGGQEDAAAATDDASAALKVAALGAETYSEKLSKVSYFTQHAAGLSMTLAAALNRVATILNQDDAAKAYRKAIDAYVKKPSVDAAKAATRAFMEAAGSFKDGSKAQAAFVTKNLPAVERAIKTSGIGKSLREKLLVPLEQARRAAIRVQETIDLIHGKRIAITYTGGTPTNQGGYHRALGGAVFGPGTGTSDSIPAMLSNGEYVIRAAAAQRIGYAQLDALNGADRMPALPSIVNAPTIQIPTGVGRDAPLIGHMEVHAAGQIDFEAGLAREARRQERDRRTRMARGQR